MPYIEPIKPMSHSRRLWLKASGAVGKITVATAIAAGSGAGAGYMGQDYYRTKTGYDVTANANNLESARLKLEKIKAAKNSLIKADETIKDMTRVQEDKSTLDKIKDTITNVGEISRRAIEDLKQNIFDGELFQKMLYDLYSTKNMIDKTAFALPFAFMFMFVYMGTRRLLDTIVEDPIEKARYLDTIDKLNELSHNVNLLMYNTGLMQDGTIDTAVREAAANDTIQRLIQTMPELAQAIAALQNSDSDTTK